MEQTIEGDSKALVNVPAQPVALMTVIERLASNPNVDVDKIQRLLEMQERWELNKAKASFRESMAEFKKNPPEIIRRRMAEMNGVAKSSGKEYSIKILYADLENVTTAITDGLANVGITHAFQIKQEGERITVTCILSRGIYSEEGVTLTAGPDVSGAKNPIQSVASTVSYLERYTLLAATGMAAGMPDTDGNPNLLSSEDQKRYLDAIKTSPDEESLRKVYESAKKAATDAKDEAAFKLFGEAKNTRYKEINCAKGV